MITEDYVGLETAKLLKEKGFDEPCLMCYTTSDKKLGNYGHYRSFKNSEVFALTAPTLQMAMKWLRERHNLYVDIILHSVNHTLIYETRIDKINSPSDIDAILPQINELTYENACEAAIKYCLENLI